MVGEMLTCFLAVTVATALGAMEAAALLAVIICAALFLYSAEASSVRVRLRCRLRASRLCNSDGVGKVRLVIRSNKKICQFPKLLNFCKLQA